MTESQDSPQEPVENDKKWKTVLIGYQMAISLWTYQGEQVWARFSIILVANSIFVAAIAAVFTIQDPLIQEQLFVFTVGLPIIGLILCVFWFLLMKRESKYADYYINSARELEELDEHLAPLEIVSKGALLAKGREVTLKIGGKDKPFKMDCLARLGKAKTISNFVIALFILLYAAVIFQNVWLR